MVQGHLFTEVIDQSLRSLQWYRYHAYIHGFTAPMFLFGAGMAFGITTLAKWEDHTRFSTAVRKRYERYAILLALGYATRLYEFKLSFFLSLDQEGFNYVTRVDALQVIGVSLVTIQALAYFSRKRSVFLTILAGLFITLLATAPFAEHFDLAGWPVPIVAYINRSTTSLFPLFPWAGFIVAGVLMAAFVRHRRKNAKAGLLQLVLPLGVLGGGLIFLGDYLAHADLDAMFPDHNFWHMSPWFVMVRLGVVLCTLATLCLVELGIHKLRAVDGPALRVVQAIGAQTLVIYIVHLFVLYGGPGIRGLGPRFDHALQLAPAAGLAVLFLSAMFLLGWTWHQIKTRYPKRFDQVRYGITAALVLVFLIS